MPFSIRGRSHRIKHCRTRTNACKKQNFINKYNLDLTDMNADLDVATLEKGTYTYKYRVAIARGGVDLENFEFTV